MTRKDYVAIAAAIHNAPWSDSMTAEATITAIAENIAEVMSRDNPRFDRERFLKACGVQS